MSESPDPLSFRNKPRNREPILIDASKELSKRAKKAPYIRKARAPGKYLPIRFNAEEWAAVLSLKDYWGFSDYAGTIKKAVDLARLNESEVRAKAEVMKAERKRLNIPLKWLE